VPDLSPAACAAQLAERFPGLFGAGRALPIKLRIQADIQAHAPGVFNKKSLSIFLHRHTTSTAYLKALVNSPQRFDLDGAPAGELADEHRQAATAELERRRGIFEARRAAEREAQRTAFNAQRDQARAEHNAARAAAQATRAAEQTTERAAERAVAAAAAPVLPTAPAAPAQPMLSAAEMEARRERSNLLRAYETSTLTRANFCALKGMKEDQLEAQLLVARQEREQRAQEPRPERAHVPQADAPRGPRPQRRDERGSERGGPRGEPRRDGRGPRPGPGKPPAKPER
jgi:sRNA-binding protein